GVTMKGQMNIGAKVKNVYKRPINIINNYYVKEFPQQNPSMVTRENEEGPSSPKMRRIHTSVSQMNQNTLVSRPPNTQSQTIENREYRDQSSMLYRATSTRSQIIDDPQYRELRETSSQETKGREKVYSEVEALRQCVRVMEKDGMILITGPSQSRDALGRALLNHYSRQGFVPLVIHDAEQKQFVSSGRKRHIFLLEDILGDGELDENLCEEWSDVFADIPKSFPKFRSLLVVSLSADVNTLCRA
ncbi:hypothetical protein BaRGS_00036319, partial [Batillaria attramentaria]